MATRQVQPQTDDVTSFTNPSASDLWTLTAADAEAVIDSLDSQREPSPALKAAYRRLVETDQQP